MSDLYFFRTRDDGSVTEVQPEPEPVTQGYVGRDTNPLAPSEIEFAVETDPEGNVTVRGKTVTIELTLETDTDGNVTVRRADG